MDKFEKDLQKKLQDNYSFHNNEKEYYEMKLKNLKGTNKKARPFFLKYKITCAFLIVLFCSSIVYSANVLDVFNGSEVESGSKAIQELFKNESTQIINKTISNDDVSMTLDEVLVDSNEMYLGITYTFKKNDFKDQKNLDVLFSEALLKTNKTKLLSYSLPESISNRKEKINANLEIMTYAKDNNNKNLKVVISLSANPESQSMFNKLLKSDTTVSFVPDLMVFGYEDTKGATVVYKKLLSTIIKDKFDFKLDRKINSKKTDNYSANHQDIISAIQDNTSFTITYIFTENDKSYKNYDIETMIRNLSLTTQDNKVYRSTGYQYESGYEGDKYKTLVKVSFPVAAKDKSNVYIFKYFSDNTPKKEYKLKIENKKK